MTRSMERATDWQTYPAPCAVRRAAPGIVPLVISRGSDESAGGIGATRMANGG